MIDKTPRIGRLGWIQIDTSDPERLAAFWKLILGVEIEGRLGSPPQFVNLHKQYPDAPNVSFQRVPEPKVVKNRVHMDIVVDDVEIATSLIVQLEAGEVGLMRTSMNTATAGGRWLIPMAMSSV